MKRFKNSSGDIVVELTCLPNVCNSKVWCYPHYEYPTFRHFGKHQGLGYCGVRESTEEEYSELRKEYTLEESL